MDRQRGDLEAVLGECLEPARPSVGIGEQCVQITELRHVVAAGSELDRVDAEAVEVCQGLARLEPEQR